MFGLLYLLALGLMLVGTFGLFGSESGPLAAVFLVPLGFPWVLLLDGVPQAASPWSLVLCPLLNLLILAAICRRFGAARRR